MQTLADSELGVSRYPIFSYDSRGGGGMAKGADLGQHMRPLHCTCHKSQSARIGSTCRLCACKAICGHSSSQSSVVSCCPPL